MDRTEQIRLLEKMAKIIETMLVDLQSDFPVAVRQAIAKYESGMCLKAECGLRLDDMTKGKKDVNGNVLDWRGCHESCNQSHQRAIRDGITTDAMLVARGERLPKGYKATGAGAHASVVKKPKRKS